MVRIIFFLKLVKLFALIAFSEIYITQYWNNNERIFVIFLENENMVQ